MGARFTHSSAALNGPSLEYARHLIDQSEVIFDSLDLAILMSERRLQQSRLTLRDFAQKLLDCVKS